MIKAEEISEIIKRQLQGYEAEIDLTEAGRVIEVGDNGPGFSCCTRVMICSSRLGTWIGRARAFFRRFRMCRICLRDLARKGHIPGLIKASW